MKTERLKISALHLDPANLRRHPQRNLDVIKASLARFGQQRPILVDAKNVVRAGNGTLTAAKELGWDAIDCVRTDLSGTEATAYGIVDNRSAELAIWSEELGDELKALSDEGFDLDAVGFTREEFEAMFAPLPDDHDDSEDDDETEDDDLAAESANVSGTAYPLAVTLDRRQYQAWKAKKAELGVSGDTVAFVKLLNLGG